MRIRELNKRQVEMWYKKELVTTFVEQERKPLEVILKLIEQEEYEVLGVFQLDESQELFNEENMVGYATIAKNKGVNLLLLDYLGVTKRYRNKGVGGKILGMLKEYYNEIPIVLESELPMEGGALEENHIRERRINFYKRNDFIPVYEMATCGLRWQALIGGTKDVINLINIEDIMKLHKELYSENRYDVVIPLGKDEKPPKSCWAK